MKKHIVFLLLIAMLLGMTVTASALQVKDFVIDTENRTIKPAAVMTADGRESVNVYFDDVKIDEKGLSYILDDVVYVPFFEFCVKMGVESAIYDKNVGRITVKGDGIDISISSKKPYYTVNGRNFLTEDIIAYFDADVLMSPVKELCRLFGAEYSWNGVTNSVKIKSGGEPIMSGEEFYDKTDLFWMSHIICAEAGNESFIGKIAVGNVILNRVESKKFPDTIYGVIFDRRYGIQFSPAYSGSIYDQPGMNSIAAAKIVLEGIEVVPDNAMYFQPNYRARICWAGRNRPYICTIDGHTFWG